jgi:hypothetical protein
MRRLTKILARLSFAVVLLAVPCFAATGLENYKAVVSYTDPYHASVASSFSLTASSISAVPVRLVLYPGQTIVDLKLGDQRLTIDPSAQGGATLSIPANADKSYSISYSIVSRSRINHVPIPVPVAPPTRREHFVRVEVVLPPGDAVYDDSFPQRTWTDATHGSSRLPAVPAVVSLKFALSTDITWLMRWSSVGHLSTLLMLLFLVIGCGLLYWFKRPQDRAERLA